MPEMNRPLSPHVGIYKWQVSNTLSILHRATGVFLTLGSLALVAWIVATALGQSSYDTVLSILASPLGLLVLFGQSFAFFFHLANGISHLVWDEGYGFDKHVAKKSGCVAFIASLLVTIAFWLGVLV
jgi:succinate dehydrogenase / fumarate reductase cytochrome b subunit